MNLFWLLAIPDSKRDILDKIEIGKSLKINNVSTISGEKGETVIKVGEKGKIEIETEEKGKLPSPEEINEDLNELEAKPIESVNEGSQIKIKGTIVKIFHRKPYFNSCPDCGRSLETDDSETVCEKCGKVVEPNHRAVMSMIVDDGTGNIRIVAFGKIAEDLLGKSADEIQEIISKDDGVERVYNEAELVGREIIITGNVTKDEYRNQLQIRVKDFDFPDPQKEVKAILEKIKA